MLDEGLNMAALGHEGNSLQRYIEFDADHHALDMMLCASETKGPPGEREDQLIASDLILNIIAIITVLMLLDSEHSPIASQYETDHPPPVHRAMRLCHALASTYQRERNWDWEYVVDLHDEGWVEASRVAEKLGLAEGRWHGQTMEDMNETLLAEEERQFFAFSQKLDEENQTG